MPFAIGAGSTAGTGFGVDVPPQEGEGADFGLTIQFESNGTPLGASDATIVDFGAGITATRAGNKVSVSADAISIQFESNDTPLGGTDATTLNFGDGLAATRAGDQINLSVPTTSDAELIPGIVADGTTPNTAAITAALGLGGSFFTGNKVRARFPQGGVIVSDTFFLHPSVNLPEDARGAQVLAPIDNLSPNPSGIDEDEAFIILGRTTPVTSATLAWQSTIRGINIDARGSVQSGTHHGILVPNPDPSKSPYGDPTYTTNKDYTSPQLENLDIIGWPGSGISIQAGNGRFHGHSVRALNNGIHGFDLGGNDVVMSGHWAAGGNDGWGIKLGKTTGFYAWGGNLWSNPDTRGLTGGALWIAEKNYFVIGGTEFNDWFRADGGDNYDAGGTLGLNIFHPHAVNFISDGVLLATSGSDGSEQSNGRVIEYTSFNLMWNHSMRTDRIGTAKTISNVNTSTNTLTANNHGHSNGDIVYVVTQDAASVMPGGISPSRGYFVVGATSNTFQVSTTLGGGAVDITTTGSGNLSVCTIPTQGNFGGDLSGLRGTAPPVLFDFSINGHTNAAVNWCEAFSTVVDSKPWTSLSQTASSVDGTTVNGNTVLRINCTAHGARTNHRLGFYTTGDAPGGLTTATQEYYVYLLDNNSFALSLDPITNSAPVLLLFSTAGTGALTFYNLSTRPMKQDHSNVVNYLHMDARWGLTRIGAMGPSVFGFHGHVLLGINEDDDLNPDYNLEIGDRSAGRAALYGFTEFQNGVRYRDDAFIANGTVDGNHKDIAPGEPFHFFNTSGGGGIAAYTVNLPVDNDASYEWFIVFTGTAIASLSWGVVGQSGTTGTISGTAVVAPSSCPGDMIVRGVYRRDTNRHFILSVATGSTGMPSGRIDGTGVETGTIGERQRTFVQSTSPVALASGVDTTVGSLTLAPGTWDVQIAPGFIAAGAPVVDNYQWGISTVTNVINATKDERYGARQFSSLVANSIFGTERASLSVNISVTTTYYMVQNCVYAGSGTTVSGYGTILATRRG
jgi:hypothetical protein